MAYPLSGSQGAVTSWLLHPNLLTALSPNEATFDISEPETDVSEINSTNASYIAALRETSGIIRAHAFATPQLGNIGVANWNTTNYELNVTGFTFVLEPIAVHNITSRITTGGTAPSWSEFMPDTQNRAYGTIRCLVDNTTALSAPHPPDGSAAISLVLTYGDEATDDTLTFNAFARRVGAGFRRGDPQTAEYEFVVDGAITVAGTSSTLWREGGAGTIGSMVWPQGTAGSTLMTLTAGPSRTYAVDAFVRRKTLTLGIGEATRFDVEWQGTGAVTFG